MRSPPLPDPVSLTRQAARARRLARAATDAESIAALTRMAEECEAEADRLRSADDAGRGRIGS